MRIEGVLGDRKREPKVSLEIVPLKCARFMPGGTFSSNVLREGSIFFPD